MTFEKDGGIIYWVDPEDDSENGIYFSFDKKTVFEFYSDYPHKLTKEQIEIFKKEKPTLAALKPC